MNEYKKAENTASALMAIYMLVSVAFLGYLAWLFAGKMFHLKWPF